MVSRSQLSGPKRRPERPTGTKVASRSYRKRKKLRKRMKKMGDTIQTDPRFKKAREKYATS